MSQPQIEPASRQSSCLPQGFTEDPRSYLISGVGSREGRSPSTLVEPSNSDGSWISVIEESLVQLAETVSPNDAAARFFLLVARYLRSTDRRDRTIWRLSLTMPRWEPDTARLRQAAQTLADTIAADTEGGAWIALDFTKEGRAHIYGIALSEQPRNWFSSTWMTLTGASLGACSVKPVSGQKYGWGGDLKAMAKLSRNLSTVIHYGLKSVPARYELPLHERVVATGCLLPVWERSFAGHSSVQSGNQPTMRRCQRCGEPLPPKTHSHARWCSRTCRTMAWQARCRLRSQLEPDRLDAFEEHAAILEFDARMTRPQAEQRAFEHQRQGMLLEKARLRASQPSHRNPGLV